MGVIRLGALPRLILLVTASLFFHAAAHSAEPVKIRAGWVVTPASLIPLLTITPGVAQHQGKSYDFEPVFIGGSPPQITGIAAGELEIAALGFSSFPFAVLNAGISDLRIIADETQDGYDGYATTNYLVLKDSPIRTIEDLKGKTVAVNALGAGVDIGMRAALLQHGLKFQRDYTSVEVPFPNMKPVLLEHKIDLATMVLPFIFDDEVQAKTRTLFTMKQSLGTSELSMWTMRESFIQKHRAAVVDLLEDMVRVYRWYADPANHKEAVAILSRFSKKPVAALDGWAFTNKDDYRSPDGVPDLAALQRNIDIEKKLGFIKSDLDVKKYADLSLIKEADKRLK